MHVAYKCDRPQVYNIHVHVTNSISKQIKGQFDVSFYDYQTVFSD